MYGTDWASKTGEKQAKKHAASSQPAAWWRLGGESSLQIKLRCTTGCQSVWFSFAWPEVAGPEPHLTAHNLTHFSWSLGPAHLSRHQQSTCQNTRPDRLPEEANEVKASEFQRNTGLFRCSGYSCRNGSRTQRESLKKQCVYVLAQRLSIFQNCRRLLEAGHSLRVAHPHPPSSSKVEFCNISAQTLHASVSQRMRGKLVI